MKLIAHLQIEIGDDGKLRIESLGYTLRERGSRGPISNSEVQALAEGFASHFGGTYEQQGQEGLELETAASTRPTTAPDVVAGQAPRAEAPAVASRIMQELSALGVDPVVAAAGMTAKGAQRMAEVTGWLKRKQATEGLRAPTRLFESLIAR